MENTEKDKKNKNLITIKAAKSDNVIPMTNIKRMMNTLDKFLTKRFMLVIGASLAVISACTIGLVFANTGSGNAFAGGGSSSQSGGSLTASVWLWSIIAVFGFIAITASIYILGKKKANISK